MDSVKVLVPLQMKNKLTEKLKAKIIADLEEQIKEVELILQQIDLDENKAAQEIDPQDFAQMQAMRQHFGQARAEHQEGLEGLKERLETAKKLAIGAELPWQGPVQRLVELKVGDNIADISGMEVLVEDDVIVAIRG